MLAGLKDPRARLDALEIIELYEDRAYETWRGREEGDRERPHSQGRLRAPRPGFSPREGGAPSRADRAGPELVAADPDHHAPRRWAGGSQPVVHRRRRLRAGRGANDRRQPRHRRAASAQDGSECRPRRRADIARAHPVRIAVAGIAEAPQRRGAEQAAHSRRAERSVSVGIARRPAALDERRGHERAEARTARSPRRDGAAIVADPVFGEGRRCSRQAEGARHRRSGRGAGERLWRASRRGSGGDGRRRVAGNDEAKP